MEKDYSNNNNSETAPSLPPAPDVPNQQAEKPNKSHRTAGKADGQKKKSFRRNWKSSGPVARLTLIFVGIGAVAGTVLGIWQGYQTGHIAKVQHRPRVIFSRSPELVGQLNCDITDRQLEANTGAMRIWVKNIKNGDAISVFPVLNGAIFIPDKRTGIPFYDDPPQITEQTCRSHVSPKVQPFPLNAGEEKFINSGQSVGAVSLIPTPGAKPVIPKDATLQWYFSTCVYYLDEDGEPHGTCQTYRFSRNSKYSFSCSESPMTGVFEPIMFNYCEN